MTALQLRSHIGADGMLELKVPAGVSEPDVDVTVTFHPVSPAGWKSETERQEWHEFVSKTAGSVDDPIFFRHEQGEFERRDALRSQNSPRTMSQVVAFLARFVSVPFDDKAARHYAEIRDILAALGKPNRTKRFAHRVYRSRE
jgi:hypothetical protein